ncbi:MAG: hypothetical protein ACI8Q1_000784 [Parvicella sp.]|jgi:hypothetical protein
MTGKVVKYLVLVPIFLIEIFIWKETLKVEACYYGEPLVGLVFLYFVFLIFSAFAFVYLTYSVIKYRDGLVPIVLFAAIFTSAFYADGYGNLGDIEQEYYNYGMNELESPTLMLELRADRFYTLQILNGGDGCQYSGYYSKEGDTLDLGVEIVSKTNGEASQKYIMISGLCKAFDNPSDSTRWLSSMSRLK